MDALLSGKYDLNRTAVFMSQTGGGCRASNYIGFIRRALEKAGMPQVPVISVNANGMETNPGFSITLPMMTKAMQLYTVTFSCVSFMQPDHMRQFLEVPMHFMRNGKRSVLRLFLRDSLL